MASQVLLMYVLLFCDFVKSYYTSVMLDVVHCLEVYLIYRMFQ